MSQLQRCFSNDITTLCRRLLIDVFFAMLLQYRDMVKRRENNYNTTVVTTLFVYWEPSFFHFFCWLWINVI